MEPTGFRLGPSRFKRKAEILIYTQPAMVFLIATVYAAIAPPAQVLWKFTALLASLLTVPLWVVAHFSGDPMVFRLIISNSVMAIACSILISKIIDKLRDKVATLELEKEAEASKFLGPVVSKAIFQNETQGLKEARCQGFVISIDIRDSTDLLQKHGDQWLSYRKDYFKLASQLVGKHSGYIQKTVGDCHVINFGIMEYAGRIHGEEWRIQKASASAFAFIDELFHENHKLSLAHFPDHAVLLGAGMDKGWVERGVQGDSGQTLELDVNGDPVNCCSRLQEYSKELKKLMGWSGSVFVVSPFGTDYLSTQEGWIRVATSEHPVRNYPGIQWVLVKVVDAFASASDKKAA